MSNNEEEILKEVEQIVNQASDTYDQERKDMTMAMLPQMVKGLSDWIKDNEDKRFKGMDICLGFVIPDLDADVSDIAKGGDGKCYVPVGVDTVLSNPQDYCAGKMMPFYGFEDYDHAIECLGHKGMAIVVSDMLSDLTATVLYDKELSVLIAGDSLTVILQRPHDTISFYADISNKPQEKYKEWFKSNLTVKQRKLIRTLLEFRLEPLTLKHSMPETYKAMLKDTTERLHKEHGDE